MKNTALRERRGHAVPERADVHPGDFDHVTDFNKDDFVLMPHAMSQWPYPPGFIKRGLELKLTLGAEPKTWDVYHIDYGAVDPQGRNTIHVQYKGDDHEVVWRVDGRELSVRVGGKGITQQINRATDLQAIAAETARTMLRFCDTDSNDAS